MLAISNLDVYYGQSKIINDVNINVPEGKAVCLMGRNGVGKTTLLKTIIGNLNSRHGKIVYEDDDVTQKAAHRRARLGIGYVPQGRGIFPYLTVYENLMIGFEAVPHMSTAEQQDSIEYVYSLFPVLKEMRHRMAGTLSGGQQQQLAIGRTLVRRPSLVLMDEPTEGIQPSIVEQIEQVIHDLRVDQGIAVLLIEQFLDFALNVADYCYVMDKGHIVSEGAASDLNEDAIREYLSV
ncbi:MAG: urea ABC transporter ATP-binding subunit UrtE [Anaerolineaceae bacterium]|nr:urea ABC transporter ATP-binding subunit UrtE [Anaerolineaceae bacterium]